jgi:hypothetical protein
MGKFNAENAPEKQGEASGVKTPKPALERFKKYRVTRGAGITLTSP